MVDRSRIFEAIEFLEDNNIVSSDVRWDAESWFEERKLEAIEKQRKRDVYGKVAYLGWVTATREYADGRWTPYEGLESQMRERFCLAAEFVIEQYEKEKA